MKARSLFGKLWDLEVQNGNIWVDADECKY